MTVALTTYAAERDRGRAGFLADELLGLYARHRVRASVVLRGAEGYGHHGLHSERLLTSAEDLPLVTIAMDTREAVAGLLPEVSAIHRHGLVAVGVPGPGPLRRITVLTGRGGAARETVAAMHAAGVTFAAAFLGVDGTVLGERRRARLLAHNAGVPVAVVGVGGPEAVQRAAAAVGSPLVHLDTLGVAASALARISIHLCDVQAPAATSLVTHLRAAGAPGATVLRGVWGYGPGQRPHGDGLLAPRRRVPAIVSVVDVPESMDRWLAVVGDVGLVTTEGLSAAAVRQDALP